MLTLFGKKRVSETKLANVILNTIFDRVEHTFEDVAGFINEAPEFVTAPQVQVNDSDRFLMIIVVANLKQMSSHLTVAQDNQLTKSIVDKLSGVFDLEESSFAKTVHEYRAALARVNHPSKNLIAAMSKMVFFRYGLNQYQDISFKEIQQPNPLFIQRMNDIMEHYLWNWESFLNEYKVIA